MQASATPAAPPAGTSPDLLRAAFRDLHGARLHGFALLVTLGDRPKAARVANRAIAAGVAHLTDLRHPERAAAWLRARVLADVRRAGRSHERRSAVEARAALETMGVDAGMLSGLAVLSVRERGAIVADCVERLDRRDVAAITGMDGARLDRLIRRARARYAAEVADAPDALADGPTANRIRTAAARVLA